MTYGVRRDGRELGGRECGVVKRITMHKINPSNYSPPNVNYWGDRCCKAEAEVVRLRAAYVEAARLLSLDQLSQLSKASVRVLADLGLLVNGQ